MTTDNKHVQLPEGFVDPRDKMVLNVVPRIDVTDLPLPPVAPLDREKYRQAVIAVDKEFVGPVVHKIARAVGVDVIDDEFYNEVVPTTDKSSSLFVIRSRAKVHHNTDKGFSEWEGIEIRVKGMIVAGVVARAYAATNEGAFMLARLYDNRVSNYVVLGDPEGKRAIKADSIPQMIMNYLEQEGIISRRLIEV
jgi:hypothetical protein